ncbi:MAG: hypothetical protein WD076_08050, partial [Parvularculaceae bacterium]
IVAIIALRPFVAALAAGEQLFVLGLAFGWFVVSPPETAVFAPWRRTCRETRFFLFVAIFPWVAVLTLFFLVVPALAFPEAAARLFLRRLFGAVFPEVAARLFLVGLAAEAPAFPLDIAVIARPIVPLFGAVALRPAVGAGEKRIIGVFRLFVSETAMRASLGLARRLSGALRLALGRARLAPCGNQVLDRGRGRDEPAFAAGRAAHGASGGRKPLVVNIIARGAGRTGDYHNGIESGFCWLDTVNGSAETYPMEHPS